MLGDGEGRGYGPEKRQNGSLISLKTDRSIEANRYPVMIRKLKERINEASRFRRGIRVWRQGSKPTTINKTKHRQQGPRGDGTTISNNQLFPRLAAGPI